MGSSLVPALADIFMNWQVETATIKSNHQFTVHRYVDDWFLTFNDPNQIDHVFRTFNSIHQKTKFTKELEENNKLAFLDVQITKKSDCIETTIFRKKTNLDKMRQLCSESIQTKLGLDVTTPGVWYLQ